MRWFNYLPQTELRTMYYYPHLLDYKDFVHLIFIVPGGWGQDLDKITPDHFLQESLFYAPTKSYSDPIEFLWNKAYDFWSITSFESIRLGVTVPKQNVGEILTVVHEMLSPREIEKSFIQQEISDLQTVWNRERDREEDQVLRDLFPLQNVVHPSEEGVLGITEQMISSIYEFWKTETPHLIIMGEVNTDDLLLAQNWFDSRSFEVIQTKPSVKSIESFFSIDRLGLKIELTSSDWRELFLIEIWDRQFEGKIFFEYHINDFFIWTGKIQNPQERWSQMKTEVFSRAIFEKSKFEYGEYLSKLFKPGNTGQLEKLAEFVEGFHSHEFQAGTYQITQEDFDIRSKVLALTYEEMVDFWEEFMKLS